MTTIIETRGGGDEFFHRDEVLDVEELLALEPVLGRVAIKHYWTPLEIVRGPSLKSLVQPKLDNSILFTSEFDPKPLKN